MDTAWRPPYQSHYRHPPHWDFNLVKEEGRDPGMGIGSNPFIELRTGGRGDADGVDGTSTRSGAIPSTHSATRPPPSTMAVTTVPPPAHTGSAPHRPPGSLCPFCPNAPGTVSHLEASHLNQLFQCLQCTAQHGYIDLRELTEHWETKYGKGERDGRFPENLQQTRCNLCPREVGSFLGNGQRTLLDLHIQSKHPHTSLSRDALVSHSCRACPSLLLPPSPTQEHHLRQHIQHCHAAQHGTGQSQGPPTHRAGHTGHPSQLAGQTRRSLSDSLSDKDISITSVSTNAPVAKISNSHVTSISYNIPVTSIAPNAPVVSIFPKTPISTISPKTPISTISPKTPVSTISPKTPIAAISPKTPIAAISPKTPVVAISSNTPVPSESPSTPITSTFSTRFKPPPLPSSCKSLPGNIVEVIELDEPADHELLPHRVGQCPFCPPGLEIREDKEQHLRSHRAHLFSCAACGIYFTDYSKVGEHVHSVHRVTDWAKVPQSVLLPKDVHSLIILECTLCRRSCIGQCEAVMASHVLDSHWGRGGSNTIRRACRLCNRTFSECSQIQAHIAEIHPKEGFAQDTEDSEDTEEGSDDIAIIEVKEGNAGRVSSLLSNDVIDKTKEKTGKTPGFLGRWEKETKEKLIENDQVNKKRRLSLEYVNIVSSEESTTTGDSEDGVVETNKDTEAQYIEKYVKRKTRKYLRCKKKKKSSSKKSKSESKRDESKKDLYQESIEDDVKVGAGSEINKEKKKVGNMRDKDRSKTDLYKLKDELKELLVRSKTLNKKWRKIQQEKKLKQREEVTEVSPERSARSVNRDTSDQDTNNRDTSNQDTSNRDTSNRDTSNRDTSNRDTSNRDTSNRDTRNQDTNPTIPEDARIFNGKELSKKAARKPLGGEINDASLPSNSQGKTGSSTDGKRKRQQGAERRDNKVISPTEVGSRYGNSNHKKVFKKPFTMKWKMKKT